MATVLDADQSGWRFAQCFGDKGEVSTSLRYNLMQHLAHLSLSVSTLPVIHAHSKSKRSQRQTSSRPSSSTTPAHTLQQATREDASSFLSVTRARSRRASTSFTLNFSPTNQSLTISSRSRLRKRSTRLDGAGDRTRPISCCLRMVGVLFTLTLPPLTLSLPPLLRPCFVSPARNALNTLSPFVRM